MKHNIISLGSWCRPAWQIRRHFGVEMAFPYDWNITSCSALKHTLSSNYDPMKELLLENCVINQFGSITDSESGIIFQHDLLASNLNVKAGGTFLVNDTQNLDALENARQKSAALFKRFKAICSSSSPIFIRWLRNGHPDGEWAEAFKDETAEETYETLSKFCNHQNFKLLYVTSVDDEPPVGESVLSVKLMYYGANVSLFEFLPDGGEMNWTGSSESWSQLFEFVSKTWLDDKS